ncbi:MAG TPA: hypothetical protein VIM11_19475 [Tepidisphaeraceae bacterium]|jgi:hypothetical protein
MMTVRQIERHWDAKAYDRLVGDLLTARPEGSLRLGVDLSRSVCGAALAVIRLDELDQGYAKIYPKLIRSLVMAQEADGGWGDLVTTALCLRALFCGQGNGTAIDHGLKYLADLQKTEGIWPHVPIRRMPSDPYISALVMYELGDQAAFRRAVRLEDATHWFAANESSLDDETRQLWNRARVRCRLGMRTVQMSLC